MEGRSQESSANVINVIAGIWLIISPFVLGFSTGITMINSVVLGILVGVLALITAITDRAAWLSWINIVLGLWLIVAPFALNSAELLTATWNSVILGAIVIIFAGWSTSLHASGHRVKTA